ncbi:hypothetical protein Belba_3725 [Belliella baltica DSM 15883]|uniref:Oxygen tolerance n=1 Tax=Belliella baltica (strain DSM 15883 / CIP 108006 / LMG 21964 / BA134) TaxID=866536 RepID=I3ZAE5_BELBD|nr:hypothetical protein [Belliella baltica]AFL86213.1 hypothetical protein Belba_3725 [Belliella baltica DSM 15883]
MAKTRLTLLGFTFLMISAFSFAQELKVEGYFLQDSAKLGEKVPYVLKATYGKGYNIIFPDSTYDFSPFVFHEKQTFISSTKEGLTLDSAVYYVANFSLDPVLKFSLPVYEILKYDSITYYADEADLALKLMINPLPEQLNFQDNNVYQPIDTDFNYPLLIGILVAVVILAGVLLFFFGKPLQKRWRLWLEKRKYKRFLLRWEKAEASFSNNPDTDNADELLGLWKAYMEHLKSKPFREWTTVEISNFLENKEIIKDFREIEMIIYAGKEGKDIGQACQNLKGICAETYQQKITQKDERK